MKVILVAVGYILAGFAFGYGIGAVYGDYIYPGIMTDKCVITCEAHNVD